MSTEIQYRLRVRDGDDAADLFIVTSHGTNPFVAQPPTGDGESLDPLTGKVSVGAYTIEVIDASGDIAYDTEAFREDFGDYADTAAMLAVWTVTDAEGIATVDLHDGAYDSSNLKSMRYRLTNETPSSFPYEIAISRQVTGLVAGRTYVMSPTYLTLGPDGGGPFNVWRPIPYIASVDNFSRTVTADGSGNATIHLTPGIFSGSPTLTNYFDNVALVDSVEAENRLVTGYLADATGRQQLLSKRAYIEESTNGGADWDVLTAGYVTDLALIDALRYQFSIGSSQRIEQSKRVFDRIPDPATQPSLCSRHLGTPISGVAPTLDRASCIVGGPILGDWGPHVDRGRPIFRVESVGGQYVRLEWLEGFVSANFHESGPPVRDDVAVFMNAAALEYLDSSRPVVGSDSISFAPLPGLVARIWDVSSGDWVGDHHPVARQISGFVGRIMGDWVFTGPGVNLFVRWNGTVPAVGTRYRMAIFPRSVSQRNPFHVSGHPVDIATQLLTYAGLTFDVAAAQSVKSDLGSGLTVHLRITESATLADFLEQTLYGPFGFAARLNNDGEQEFFLTRQVGAPSVGVVTIDDLRSDEGVVWGLKEQDAANRVVWESESYLVNDAAGTVDESTPIDCITVAKVTVNVTPSDATEEHRVFGDREIRYTLPGEIEGYFTGTPEEPGTLDHFVTAIAQPLFDWQGRGAIRGEIHVLRGVTDAVIGQEITLDLTHYPSAVIGDTPVAQRGSGPRRAYILQRTNHPEGPTFQFEDRGPADDLGLVPEFTLAPDATFPKTTVEVTVTNEAALIGTVVRVEMLTAAIEPSAGQFVRLWHPGAADNPFDLPPVCAGNIVWVRMRAESAEGEIGAWSPFQALDLEDLATPTDLAVTVEGTYLAVTWTLGETTVPVEVLYRRSDEVELTVSAVLPAGSTSHSFSVPDAEDAYTVAVRHVDRACKSAMAEVGIETPVALELDPPIDPVAFGDGQGHHGLEVTATEIPSATEFWSAIETDIGTGIACAYVLVDTITSEPQGRTRLQHPLVAAQDGLLRFWKARHIRAGFDPSDFTAEVSINPWLIIPPEPPTPDPPQVPGLTETPIEIVLLGATLPRRFWAVPADATPLTDTGVAQTKFPLGAFKYARVVATVGSTSLPVGALFRVEFEPSSTPDAWTPLDGETGPSLTIDTASVGALTGKARSGDWVEIVDDALDDVRLRAVLIGGDDDTAKILSNPRVVLQLTAHDAANIEEPETTEPAPDDPGSCDIPSPLDMDTGWTGGDETGIVWSAGSDTSYTATLDGTGSGDNYWEKTLTGLEADELYTFYLTVSGMAGAFLQVVGGDTATASDDAEETLVARGESNGSGEITLRWGITALEDAPTSEGSDDLDYATQAAAEAAGWVVTDTMSGAGVTFDSGHAIAGSGVATSVVYTLNGIPSSPALSMVKTYNVGAGAGVKGKLWAEGSGSRWEFLTLEIRNTAGQFKRENCDGNDGVEHLITDPLTAGGDGLITVSIFLGAAFPSNHVNHTYHFSGLELEGVTGGGAVILFEDLGSCLGSGVGDGGTGVGGDPDTPGNEPIPTPPPGGYPPPVTGGDRPFGISDIPAAGLAYWNSTVKRAIVRQIVNVLNDASAADARPLLGMGPQSEWGKPFVFDNWKDQMDELFADTASRTALEAAIASGFAPAHFVIDEPGHKTRYGGPIPFATVERMFQYSKHLYPTWRTILRTDPTDDRLVRIPVGCDTLWAEYKLTAGSVETFKSSRIGAANDWGVDLIVGVHYFDFGGLDSNRAITPAELRHYGGIMATSALSGTHYASGLPLQVIAMMGWKYTTAMYAQAGFPDALRYVRDLFAANDP